MFKIGDQNKNLGNKIVAGLERISQVYRTLLWDKAKEFQLSPIQIQLLLFIDNHSAEKCTVSYLAKEFNLTKPTISDAVKILEEKKMIKKHPGKTDTRSYTISLTAAGKRIVGETENFAEPVSDVISTIPLEEQRVLWKSILDLITQLNRSGIITVQRSCFNCKYYGAGENKEHYCSLMDKALAGEELRMDCPEFEPAKL